VRSDVIHSAEPMSGSFCTDLDPPRSAMADDYGTPVGVVKFHIHRAADAVVAQKPKHGKKKFSSSRCMGAVVSIRRILPGVTRSSAQKLTE